MSYKEQNIDGKFDTFVNQMVQKTRAIGHILNGRSFVVLTERKVIAGVMPIDAGTIVDGIDQLRPSLNRLDLEYVHEDN